MKLVRGSDVVLFVTVDARDATPLRQILVTFMSIAVPRLRRYESALDVIVGSLECDSEVPPSVWLPWRRPLPAEPADAASVYIFYTLYYGIIRYYFDTARRSAL